MSQVILRPIGAGQYTEWDYQYPASGSHWDKVDEVVANDNVDFVYTDTPPGKRDLYDLPDSGIPSGSTINWVKINIKGYSGYWEADAPNLQTGLRSGTTDWWGGGGNPGSEIWTDLNSGQLTTNPTTGLAWTLAQVNALQAGAKATTHGDGGATMSLTFVEVVVDYTPGANSLTDTQPSFLMNLDPTTDSQANYIQAEGWQTKTPLTHAIADVCAITYSGKLYTFGGYGTSTNDVKNYVQQYNPSTDSWTDKTAMPTARWGAAAAMYNGKAYVFAGAISSNTLTDVCEAYDIASNTWSTMTPVPSGLKIQGLMAATVGNKIYLFGNIFTYEFDPSGNGGLGSYASKANAPVSRTWGTCAYVNVGEDRIYIIGGWSVSAGTSHNYYYRPSTNTWSSAQTPAPYASWGQTRDNVEYDGIIYYGYGQQPLGTFFSYLYSYNPATDTWTQLTSGLYPRDGPGCGFLYGTLYVVGGRNVDPFPYGLDYNEAYALPIATVRISRSNYIGGASTITNSQPNWIFSANMITDSQPNYVAGHASLTDSQANYFAGYGTLTDSQANYVGGHLSLTDSQANYIAGLTQVSSFQGNFLTGHKGFTDSQVNYLAGLSIAVDSQTNYIEGVSSIVDSQADYISGLSTTTDSQGNYSTGHSSTTDFQGNYTAGIFTLTDAQGNYIEGTGALEDSQRNYLAGLASLTDTQPSYIAGTVSVSDSQANYVHNALTSITDSQGSYVAGKGLITGSQGQYIGGLSQILSMRGNYLAGYGTIADSQANYIHNVFYSITDSQANYIHNISIYISKAKISWGGRTPARINQVERTKPTLRTERPLAKIKEVKE